MPHSDPCSPFSLPRRSYRRSVPRRPFPTGIPHDSLHLGAIRGKYDLQFAGEARGEIEIFALDIPAAKNDRSYVSTFGQAKPVPTNHRGINTLYPEGAVILRFGIVAGIWRKIAA